MNLVEIVVSNCLDVVVRRYVWGGHREASLQECACNVGKDDVLEECLAPCGECGMVGTYLLQPAHCPTAYTVVHGIEGHWVEVLDIAM